MLRIICTSMLSVLAIVLLADEGQARGGRGGGRGGGLRMGSVRHSRHYNRGRQPRHETRRREHRHREIAHHTVDPVRRRAEVRRIAVGRRFNRLPRGYRRYVWRSRHWYFCAGVWYIDDTGDDATEYVVTDPPAGITVAHLPTGTEHVVVDRRTLYLCQGIYYKAIWTDGHATYVVTKL